MHSRLTSANKKPTSPAIKQIKSSSTSSTTTTLRSNSLKKTAHEPIKRTNSPTTSPTTVKKNVSSHLNRASTISSTSNLRRNSSLYAANHSTNVNIQELEEITNLNTQLNQWIYLNAMTADAYESQKKEAEKQLYNGYKYITKQKDIYNNLNVEYFNKSNLIKVNEDLDIQEECISIIENQLNKFKQIYEDFLIALHSTASKMTTHGIITKDIDNLTKQFNECEKNLKILTEQKEKLEKVNKLSNLINSLNIILKEELEELNEFKELLNKLKKAETLNNSLQIQYVSLNNKK
ncbi:hypothetical protein BCR32DRAFT_270631 [Anaeromyces robustus]|uniref:Uncharacterized protein n=1 Tax=Anaeromyces robustus TaxID=1754192 RepID=A0A1Y1WV84_9FUNG|nr:hypothetical protein BCR32DRAFT_270631 [Anaeromyces robustus]|eukprot:ORX77469.1 hypothetical protein BCR32DRAFT_270631 [Anaeromyces robustus]